MKEKSMVLCVCVCVCVYIYIKLVSLFLLQISLESSLTLLQTDKFLKPCKVDKLFSENLQDRGGYVQTINHI